MNGRDAVSIASDLIAYGNRAVTAGGDGSAYFEWAGRVLDADASGCVDDVVRAALVWATR